MAELQKIPWPDWEIVKPIGRGSFGVVINAQNRKHKRAYLIMVNMHK